MDMGRNEIRGVINGNTGIKKDVFVNTIHAEIKALSKLKTSKKQVDMVVIKIGLNGEMKYSRPCYHCIVAMIRHKYTNIRYVYYSISDKHVVRESVNQMLKSPLTIMSTGWRMRYRVKLN